ncbi:MAG: hypothetical protein K2I10_14995 [Lachnospiraceae bacterium]|nr:hypothetical protein [Lachnospiraceae bacterium]
MMKKKVRYLIEAFMVVAMLCGLNGCSSINSSEDIGQSVTEVEDKQITEQDNSSEIEETALSEEHNDTEKATSGEDLDVVEPNVADDEWYREGNIYTDDKGNQVEVFFDDYGMLGFAVNGLSLYFTTVDNFQQENNWKIYTCDDDTTIIYYPGEPAHLEISGGDYAGLYEASDDKTP